MTEFYRAEVALALIGIPLSAMVLALLAIPALLLSIRVPAVRRT